MSATIGGAIKALLEAPGLNLGIAVYSDAAPSSVTPPNKTPFSPYVIVNEGIGLTLDSGKAADTALTGKDLVQLDLWQCWRVNDKAKEIPTLPDAITRAVHSSRLTTVTSSAPMLVYGCKQQGRVRRVERDNNLTHYIYTLAVLREV